MAEPQLVLTCTSPTFLHTISIPIFFDITMELASQH